MASSVYMVREGTLSGVAVFSARYDTNEDVRTGGAERYRHDLAVTH